MWILHPPPVEEDIFPPVQWTEEKMTRILVQWSQASQSMGYWKQTLCDGIASPADQVYPV